MPETTAGPVTALFAVDQASGLRRLFEKVPPAWTLVLLPRSRAGQAPEALAARMRQCSATGSRTLVVDAARAQVAPALGLRLRYDLDHVLAGDCAIDEACADAGDGLWVLPASRAVDAGCADERHGRRVAGALQTLAQGMRNVVVLLPAGRVAWIRALAPLAQTRVAQLVVASRQEAGSAILSAVRQVMSESEIDTFHLLFPGMGEQAAGRLLSGMAAIAQRHFGATLLAAPGFAPVAPARIDTGPLSVETAF